MATFANSITIYPDKLFDKDVTLSSDFYDKDDIGGRYGVQKPNESTQAELPDYSGIIPGGGFDGNFVCGPAVATINRRIDTILNSVENENYIRNVLRGIIYYTPVEIDSFILEDVLYAVTIWNAKYYDVIISNMAVDEAYGTEFTPWGYPAGIGEDQYTSYDLIVSIEGPPTQDTTYTLTIDGEDYETNILGSRIMPFTLPINWDNGYKLGMAYNTIIQDNGVKREQRRSLQAKAYKKIDVTITVGTVDEQDKFVSWAKAVQNRIIGVPLFQEAVFSTTNMSVGQTAVIVDEDISQYYFLPDALFALVVDYTTNVYEIKELTNVNTTTRTLTFAQGIKFDYDKATAAIYPLTFTYAESFNFNVETDTASIVNIRFLEYKKDI